MSKEAILEKIKNLDEKLADKELSDMHSFFENAKKNLEKDLESLGGEEVKVVDDEVWDKLKNEQKPKATKKTPPKKKATKKKPTKKQPTKDEYESAMADLKKKSGMTEEKCLEIIEEYRALRKKSQERKAKENKAKTKKNADEKKRTDKLKEEGKLNEEGTLTPEAVIEQDIPKVEEKAEQEIEQIVEENTPKPTKEEPKPKPTKQGEKKIKEGVKEVAEDTTKAIQQMLMAILGVVKKFKEPSVAKASLVKLRDALTKEINKMASGGLTDGAVANMNVTQSQMSAESVNPQMYAKGGLITNQSEKHLMQVLIGLGMKSKSIYDKNKPYFDEEDRELLRKMYDRLDEEQFAKGGRMASGGEIEDRIRKDYSKTNVISDYNIEFEVIHEELNDNGIQIYIDKGDDDKGESILEEINEDYFNGKGTINDWEDRLYLEVEHHKDKTYAEGGVIKGKRMIKLYADAYNNGNRYETNRWWENDEETKEVVSEALSKRNEDLKNDTFSFMSNLPKKIEYAKGGSMASGGATESQYGSWSITIEEDENDEDLRNEEVARLIKEGYTSGYYPTWHLQITDIEGDLDESSEQHIAELVKQGYTSGEVIIESYSKGGSVNMDKHIWEGWTIRDFIEELEIEFQYHPTFKSRNEVKKWAMSNQPYYKKYIPEVVNYYWEKSQNRHETYDFAKGGFTYAEGGKIPSKIKDAVSKSKNLMDVGNYLKESGVDYDFNTYDMPMPPAMYKIKEKVDGKSIYILNKNYVDGADFINGEIAIGIMAKGGMTQGYNDRMDESLGMRHRGHHSKSHKDRRDEAKGMNKGMGNRAYQSVGSMDKMAKGGSTNANWIQEVVDSPNFEKGAFTRKAKNRGMTTMELMKDVLSNPNEYTLKTRRQAQFMKNAM